jgi:predicted Zn-dependent peptidase
MKTSHKQTLDNGITLITQEMAKGNSVHFYIAIVAGSRYENPENNGISHLIEHLVSRNIYKSLRTNDWQESYVLSVFDAYTTKDFTKYYFEVDKSDLQLARNLIYQVLQPVFDQDSLEAEKEIIAEEIAEVLDDPQRVFSDSTAKILFGDNPLSQGVLGDPKILKNTTLEQVNQFAREYYNFKNIVIVATGSLDPANLVNLLDKIQCTSTLSEAKNNSELISQTPGDIIALPSKTEQTLASWYFTSRLGDANMSTKNTFFVDLLNEYLDYRVRDKGFSYSLSVTLLRFRGRGVLEIYSSFSDDKLTEFIDQVSKNIKTFRKEFNQEVLDYAKQNMIKALKLEEDETRQVAGYLLNSYLYFGEPTDHKDVMAAIKSVDISDLDKFYELYLSHKGHLFVSGKVTDESRAKFDVSIEPTRYNR